MKVFLLIVILLTTFLSGYSQNLKNFSKEEISKKIDSININPFDSAIREMTAEALYWAQFKSGYKLMDTKLLNPIMATTGQLAPFFLRAYIFGKTNYLIKNNSDTTEITAKVYGLKNMISTYKILMKLNPTFKNKYLEAYRILDEQNQLEALVKKSYE